MLFMSVCISASFTLIHVLLFRNDVSAAGRHSENLLSASCVCVCSCVCTNVCFGDTLNVF